MTKIAEARRSGRIRRHRRVRKKIHGTAERPRLAVFRSNKHICPCRSSTTSPARPLAAASTNEADLRGRFRRQRRRRRQGRPLIAERAKAAGVDQVVFDRGGNRLPRPGRRRRRRRP
jgi:large subunit ribosomal protein L18